MPQFLMPSGKKPGDQVVLSADEAHHLSLVLRKQVGDEIHLSDGEGHRYSGVLKEISKKSAVVLLRELLPPHPKNGHVILAHGLLKGDKTEFVLQKAVELGVDVFRPFSSSRTIVEWKRGSDKIKRWRKIAEEAAKQCGRAMHMTVEEPVSFETLVTKAQAEVKIVFWEEETVSMHEDVPCMDRLRTSPASPAQRILCLIGSEGGFSKDEIALAQRHGFSALSLGPLILKAETAAITAVSLIQYELGNI